MARWLSDRSQRLHATPACQSKRPELYSSKPSKPSSASSSEDGLLRGMGKTAKRPSNTDAYEPPLKAFPARSTLRAFGVAAKARASSFSMGKPCSFRHSPPTRSRDNFVCHKRDPGKMQLTTSLSSPRLWSTTSVDDEDGGGDDARCLPKDW